MDTRKKILIIDDDTVNAHLIEEFLTESGFNVLLAHTGREGFTKIVEFKPDLVILDLFLPDAKGSAMCSALRTNPGTRSIPIILITAHQISSDEKRKGYQSGADDYLVRPFELSDLRARMNAIFQRPKPKPNPTPEQRPVEKARSSQIRITAPHSTPHSIQFFERIWGVLNHPSAVFRQLRLQEDFFIALFLVHLTPLTASLSKMFQQSGGFDAWIGIFSLGLVVHSVLWVGTAGLLNMVLPLHGVHLPMKNALTLAGLAWAPRLLSAVLGALYGVIALLGWVPEYGGFSSGLDLLPGLSGSGAASFLSHFGLFEIWSVWITLVSLWSITKTQAKRWNTASILVGVSCLIFSALISY